ncbi:MAG: PQQ-binding-like beta-propeller repeat protein, partial [candidate division WOR-3 bacterium]
RIETLDDLNHDSIPEVIVGSWNNAVILLDGRNGNQLWQTPVGNDVWTVNPIASVNGDSQSDVIAGSGDGNVYCLDGLSGSIFWSYATGGWVNSVRSINDVNGDCLQDVIAGNQFSASPGIVCCIEGDTLMVATKEDRDCSRRSTAISELKIFSADGRRVSAPHQGVYFIVMQKGGWLERKKLLILR